MQVDEEAMYSMRNNLYMQVDEEVMDSILCGIIYMQVDGEAMYSMRNNLHANG